MKKWQYSRVTLSNYTENSILRCLNEMGEEGWEYIYHKEIMEVPGMSRTPLREGTYTLFFKREKKE